MGVDEIGVAGRPPRRPGEVREERRYQRGSPRLPPQVADNSRPIGDPEVPKARRRDDFDLHTGLAGPLDRIGDEAPRGVVRVPRVRGRQNDDSH